MSLLLFSSLILSALFIEGFFSGSEIALMSADRFLLRKEAQKGNKGAKIALSFLSKPENVLVTTLVGTNLCVAFQAVLVTVFIYENLGQEYDLYSTLVLSPLVLIFGELIPKTIFQRYSEVLTPRIAPIMEVARLLFTPFTWFLNKYTAWVSKIIRPVQEITTGKIPPTRRDELRYLLTYGQKETSIKTSERRMIRRILDFSKAEAKKALIHLVNVDMIEDTQTVEEAIASFQEHGHSRMPVYSERVDNVQGVLTVFDVFKEPNPKRPVKEIMQPAFFSPESKQLENLLFTMQKRGLQLTVIVDEYGGAVGIVTLEDILEEIVGDINDEYDSEQSQYRDLGDHKYLIRATMNIDLINEQLKLDLPRGEYETLAGFLLQQFDRIPEEGDELYYRDLKFVIRQASKKAIESVMVSYFE